MPVFGDTDISFVLSNIHVITIHMKFYQKIIVCRKD